MPPESPPTAKPSASPPSKTEGAGAVPKVDPMADSVLVTRGLSAWYGASLALREIDLVIPRHKITALIGPSGCGKSTLLRCFDRMNDLIPGFRTEGEITFDGEDLSARDLDVVTLRRRVGMVFQKPNPFPKSIYQNVAWGARINGYRGDLDELVETSLRRAGLWEEVKHKLNRSGLELSGGQQQRLCIARTLAVQPEVILMDEPCSALDPIATRKVEDLMDVLKRDYTIVIVTHNMQQARRASDFTACMMLDETASQSGHRTGVVAEFRHDRVPLHHAKSPRTEAYITGSDWLTQRRRLRRARTPKPSRGAPRMSKPKILIIEDERALIEPLAYSLNREGYEVLTATDGALGLRLAQLRLPDLIVLDLMLPVRGGLDVAKDLRAAPQTRSIPIIMVTAKSEESDQLVGFAVGADDYVTKPYSVRVLVKRIKKQLLQRLARDDSDPGPVAESQGVAIDRHRHRATYRDEELPLTPTEFRLLEALVRQAGRAFTRHELMDSAIGSDAIVLERTIDVHVKSLRRKLGEGADLIETVRGVGYRFHEPRAVRA